MSNRRERATTPQLWRPGGLDLPGELAGAAKVPRGEGASPPIWLTPPVGFQGDSVAEWTCLWWLRDHKRFRPGVDFYMQPKLYAEGVNRDNRTAVDFLLPIGYDHPASAPGDFDGVVWDPLTDWTHPDPYRDFIKRQELARQRFHLVWIDGAVLEASPFDVLEKALQGIDISSRNGGA